MKILFKQLSRHYVAGKINDNELALKFDNIIQQALANEIIIWHVGKKIALTESDFDYNVNLQNMTINWGGYGSRISKENLFEYFNFQYPGDEVIDGRLKSNVTIRKNPFKFTRAYFSDDVDDAVKVEFQSLGGIVETHVSEQTIIAVSKNISNETAISSLFQGNQWSKIQFVSQDELVGLFPIKLDPQARQNADRIKEESELPKLYASDVYESSFINNKNELAKLKKLLTAETVELIDSGLLLLSSIGDPVLFDSLIEGVSLVELEVQSEIIPNKLFTGTKKLQPLHNYAIIGILKFSDSQSVICSKLKNSIKKLRIDIPALGHLDGLPNLEKLILLDSIENIISLDEISKCKNLSSLVLENCPAITSIQGVIDLPLTEFDFGISNQIESFAPLQGKTDNTGLEILVLNRFNKLVNLNGIEFYQSLSKICIESCESLTDVSALDKLPNLLDVAEPEPYSNKHKLRLYKLQSIKGLIGSQRDNLELSMGNWGDLSDRTFDKMEYLSINCSGMRNLNWIEKFPNLIGLKITCNDLQDINGIIKAKNLLGLIIESDTIANLQPLSNLKQLVALNFNNCKSLTSIEFISDLTHLKLFGGDFSDIMDVNQIQRNPQQTLPTLANCDYHYWQEISLSGLPSLNNLHDILQIDHVINSVTSMRFYNVGITNYKGLGRLKKLSKLNLTQCDINDGLISEIAEITAFQSLNINDSKTIDIQTKSTLNFDISIESTSNLTLKNTKFKNLTFSYLDSKDLSFMNGVSIGYLKIIKSRELLSLSGISNNNEINKLDIDELVNLESIDGISTLKTLRHLSFKKIPKLAVCRDLCAMDWLEDMYTEDCNSLEVQPRPKGQMLKMDLIKYQLKIAEFYQIKNTEKLLAQLETKKETKSSTLSTKEVNNIKKLLQSRDLEMVISAVNMVDSLSDEGLCDVLLDGIKMNGKQLVPNKIFTGTGPAQPFLNTGLLGVLYVASKFSKWSTFLSSIEEIEIETKVLEYMNAFSNIKSLNVWNVERVNAPLNLPNLLSFTLTKKNYDNTPLSFSLDIFSNCLNLTHIQIDRFLIISDDINSLTKLVALRELSLIGIQANHIKSLQGLASAKWMEKISLQYHESTLGEIIDLSGVQTMDNLKHLTIIGSKIKDTSSLLELTNLEYVEILSPDLVHFTPPKNFQKLAELHFGSSSYSVREFSSKNLKTLGSSFYPENIRKLNFEGTAIVNFPCLTNTKSIGYLSLSKTPICEFSQINTISEIEYLELEHCPNIVDFNGFENVTKINQFSIHNCASLRSFKGFENVIMTTNRLDLTECPSIENIEHLPVVDWNYITLYTEKLPIPNPNLSLTELRAPLLKSLKGLGTYQKVSSLTLVYGYYQGKHPLSDFSHLQEHKALKRIKISSDMPISLGIFNAFEHLEILNLVGSKNLLDPKDLKDVAIDKLYIADCNLKKADFPDYLQNNIDWQSKP